MTSPKPKPDPLFLPLTPHQKDYALAFLCNQFHCLAQTPGLDTYAHSQLMLAGVLHCVKSAEAKHVPLVAVPNEPTKVGDHVHVFHPEIISMISKFATEDGERERAAAAMDEQSNHFPIRSIQ